VAKINSLGTDLEYCGYIGGSLRDWAEAIAVDGAGNAYVTGLTESDESSFPVTVGPDLTYNGGSWDAFVAKVNTQGTALDYCGYLGGTSSDYAHAIAVDAAANAYIVGYTFSTESSFPVKVGPDLTQNGAEDGFIAKVDSQGMALEYCGFIGGDGTDAANGIALDYAGNAYVSGETASDQSSFPVKIGPDLTFNGSGLYGRDAFVAKVNSQGTSLDYCGYIGGSENDGGWSIAVGGNGSAYVAGTTESSESTFPVKVGPDLTYNNNRDIFVAKVRSDGTELEYCGYIGGNYQDGYDTAVAVDSLGNAYVTGETKSGPSTFPVKVGPFFVYGGGYGGGDAFVARVNAQGTYLDYCGYIGGSENDSGESIVVDNDGNAYVAGWTVSDELSFPVAVGPDLSHNGSSDAFVAKIPPYHILLRAGGVNVRAGTLADVLFVDGSAGDDAYRTIVLPPGTLVTLTMETPPTGPNPAAFALYVWPGEAGPSDPAVQPYGIGTACFAMPLSNGSPAPPPITLANNIGYFSLLGKPKIPNTSPAPTTIVQNVKAPKGTWTLQGIIFDNNPNPNASKPVSLTNAVVLVQQ
jgi:hypothetical protein